MNLVKHITLITLSLSVFQIASANQFVTKCNASATTYFSNLKSANEIKTAKVLHCNTQQAESETKDICLVYVEGDGKTTTRQLYGSDSISSDEGNRVINYKYKSVSELYGKDGINQIFSGHNSALNPIRYHLSNTFTDTQCYSETTCNKLSLDMSTLVFERKHIHTNSEQKITQFLCKEI